MYFSPCFVLFLPDMWGGMEVGVDAVSLKGCWSNYLPPRSFCSWLRQPGRTRSDTGCGVTGGERRASWAFDTTERADGI